MIAFGVAVTTVSLILFSSFETQDQTKNPNIVKLGKVKSKAIVEASGIACSLTYADSFWIHNDSGNDPELFLVHKSGDLLANLAIKGVENRDWEDLCSFTRNHKKYLAIGEFGDNALRRKSYRIIVIQEPILDIKFPNDKPISKSRKVIDKTVRPDRVIEFKYPDGSHNCEALAYLPDEEAFCLVTKSTGRANSKKSAVFIIPLKDAKQDSTMQTAQMISNKADLAVTAMDVSANGQFAIVRNYLFARLYSRAKNQSWDEVFKSQKNTKLIPMPVERQGEAICFSPDNEHL